MSDIVVYPHEAGVDILHRHPQIPAAAADGIGVGVGVKHGGGAETFIQLGQGFELASKNIVLLSKVGIINVAWRGRPIALNP